MIRHRDRPGRWAPFAALEATWQETAGDDPALDLGCGVGYWLARASAAGLRPVGLEPDHQRARQAAPHAPVLVGEGDRLPLADASVGTVWCLHVLHHLERPHAVLAEVRRVLRPGGHLLMAESVEDNPALRLARTAWPNWEGVPVRARFRAAELGAMVSGAGLEVVQLRQHSPLSFAAVALPAGGHHLWMALQALERHLPDAVRRRGAHVDCVARA